MDELLTAEPLIPCEFRAVQRGVGQISGVLLAYGDTATIGRNMRERWERDSVELYERGVLANRQHSRDKPLARWPNGGLMFEFGQRALRATIDLPDTSDGRDVAELCRRGILNGLSVEFRSVDCEDAGNVRVIRRATVLGVAIVDCPAFPRSQIDEVRHALLETSIQSHDPPVRRIWL